MTGLKKILIVEDDLDIINIYSSILREANYKVATAQDGQAALEQVLSFEPDIILLDIMIPNLDGLKVLKRIRTDPQYAQLHPQVIVTTNLVQKDLMDQAKKYGAEGFIVKANIVPHELVAIIQELPAPTGSGDKTTVTPSGFIADS